MKPYVAELETSIKEKLEKARQAKEKQEEQLMDKLAEQNRYKERKYFMDEMNRLHLDLI